MSRRQCKRVRHAPEDARAEIMNAAVRFLARRPYREMSVAELMTRTTLSRPAFYQYFRGVHDLIHVLLDQVEAALHGVANPWLAGEGSPLPALRESLAGVVSVRFEYGPVIRAVSEAAPFDKRLERAWAKFMGGFDDAVTMRIEQQQGDGLIRPLEAHAIAVALNRLDAATLIAEFGRRPQGDPETVLNTLYTIWVGTLYGSTRGAQERLKKSRHGGSKNKRRKDRT